MTVIGVLGLIILVLGIFLMGCGIQKSQTLTNKVIEGVTGHYTKRTIWIFLGAIFLILIGIFLMYMGRAQTYPL